MSDEEILNKLIRLKYKMNEMNTKIKYLLITVNIVKFPMVSYHMSRDIEKSKLYFRKILNKKSITYEILNVNKPFVNAESFCKEIYKKYLSEIKHCLSSNRKIHVEDYEIKKLKNPRILKRPIYDEY